MPYFILQGFLDWSVPNPQLPIFCHVSIGRLILRDLWDDGDWVELDQAKYSYLLIPQVQFSMNMQFSSHMNRQFGSKMIVWSWPHFKVRFWNDSP